MVFEPADDDVGLLVTHLAHALGVVGVRTTKIKVVGSAMHLKGCDRLGRDVLQDSSCLCFCPIRKIKITTPKKKKHDQDSKKKNKKTKNENKTSGIREKKHEEEEEDEPGNQGSRKPLE